MCVSQSNVLYFFSKDDKDRIGRTKFGNLFHNTHPLDEKGILNKSDMTGGKKALLDP